MALTSELNFDIPPIPYQIVPFGNEGYEDSKEPQIILVDFMAFSSETAAMINTISLPKATGRQKAHTAVAELLRQRRELEDD